MSPTRTQIIFIDNQVSAIYKTLEHFRQFEDLEILVFNSEHELREKIDSLEPAVVLLNLDLRPNDGITVSNELRNVKLKGDPFFIVYSDKQEEFVQELAYNNGIDAFIGFHSKPAILNLFLRNLIRRRLPAIQPARRNLHLDEESFLVYKDGKPYHLPRKEFSLFALLYLNPDRFFTKKEIADLIWHDPKVGGKRIIDVHIYNIRQQFGKRTIQSQKGKGYRFNTLVLR